MKDVFIGISYWQSRRVWEISEASDFHCLQNYHHQFNNCVVNHFSTLELYPEEFAKPPQEVEVGKVKHLIRSVVQSVTTVIF